MRIRLSHANFESLSRRRTASRKSAPGPTRPGEIRAPNDLLRGAVAGEPDVTALVRAARLEPRH